MYKSYVLNYYIYILVSSSVSLATVVLMLLCFLVKDTPIKANNVTKHLDGILSSMMVASIKSTPHWALHRGGGVEYMCARDSINEFFCNIEIYNRKTKQGWYWK